MIKKFFANHCLVCRICKAIFLIIIVLFALMTALAFIARLPDIHPLSTMMWRDKIMGIPYKRDWTSIDKMPHSLVRSVMMSEDGQFCRHHGVEWGDLLSAAKRDISGKSKRPRGASTITMQTVKNLYLWQGHSYLRKAIEIPSALWLDLIMPKRRIMEIYLNIAQWGDHIYGVEAASRAYFGIPAQDLTPAQSALLAITLPSPLKRNPNHIESELSNLAAIIERRAAAAKPYVQCVR